MKAIFKVFIPTLISYLAFTMVGIIDAIFIGNIFGEKAQAGISLINPLLLITIAIIFSLIIGTNTYFGHAIGEGDNQKANKILNHGVIYGTITMIVLLGSFTLLLPLYVRTLASDPQVIDYAISYGSIILIVYAFMYLATLLAFIQRALNNPKVMSIQAAISLFGNIIFNSFFVFGLKMGIEGIAYASLTSILIQLIFILTITYRAHDRRLKINFVPFDWQLFKMIFINGLSDGIFDMANSIIMFTNNVILMLYFGEIGLTYMYLISQASMIQLMIFFALSDSGSPLISRAYGAKDFKKVKMYRTQILQISFILSIILYTLLFFIKGPIFTLFGATNEQLAYLKQAGNAYFAVAFFFGLNQTYTAFYTATGHSLLSLIIGITRNIVLVILMTIILTLIFGDRGMWFGYVSAEALAFIGITLYDRKVFVLK